MSLGSERSESFFKNESTEFLFAGTRAGDRGCAEVLCHRLTPSIFLWIELYLRGAFKSRLATEDVVQEVWVRIFQLMPKTQPDKGSIRSWIWSVTRNVVHEAKRKACAKPTSPASPRWLGSQEGNAANEILAEQTSMTGRLHRLESAQLIREVVERLSEEQRQLLRLCGLEGRSVPEAAAILGLSRTAVEKRWQRLRAALSKRAVLQKIFDV